MSELKAITNKNAQTVINAAIQLAERNTSGKIRVHIDKHCKIDVLDQAAFLFRILEMHKTTHRNGVLFYLALKDRKFALLGDSGINAKVSDIFWDEIKYILANHFKKGDFAGGLADGIRMAGDQLKIHFPN